MTITKRRLLEGGAAAFATSLFAPGAWSQPKPAAAEAAWPTKPVRILVGFPAGASPDLAARAIAEPLAKILRQPVTVENKPGSSGNLVADQVAKATDDHTIGALINGNLTIAKLLNPAIPFDPEKDFAPVGMVGTAPLVLAVSGNAPGKTPADLLLWARNLGTGGKYGTPGVGTVGHLGMELLKSRAAITAQHKPYTGNPQVIAGLLGGEIQLALLPPGLALPHLKSGKLKAIGVTSPERSPLASELPTIRDADVRGADLEIWTALAAPAGMNKNAVARLSAALSEVTSMPDVAQALLKTGWQAQPGTPEALARRMRADTARLGGVIIMKGIHSEA
ncbi:tripartite-type tricarboxylate transporter receptor subunit TctC [Variovorax boronicumulans]|uniref:Bug family tripartite tricarboxylate transporter substrate binding protein n=1 Tax=Variovorax TaxID=34072 RepID=UPI00278B30B9|nr:MULTISPECIES: tripartite tricarboxylate transporter substrate binding protein [Variovorax]MDQ0038194.1 tripartite-type tricarboxylate transporter receptor subunit TctC [Variovorax boronicumulans]MDQ0044914.1 tripartite-type tricarboxylate transporter receptor subunit TctC [Variovorax boronicumulans]MDQ0072174.1 tripartite-type tricarboxylate transporter receptor subunit TctC [Variovorax boronicumulans]MDQ0606148.1 tripartite-type tricarboxylate transporter receptor subunit TctC [Variovorax s